MQYPPGLDECLGADGRLDMEKVKGWERGIDEKRVSHAAELMVIVEKLLGIQVCARKELTRERINELANQLSPCGTTNGWSIAEDVAPVTCADDAGRLHWVLSC